MTKLFLFKNQIFFIPALVLSSILATPIEEKESAHQHGIVGLSIVVERHNVEIELTVPGSDVVGFEQEPSSKSDRQAVMTGAKRLDYGNGIITLSSEAKCRFAGVEVASELMEEKKDDHNEVHSEFIAHYHFHFDNPQKLAGATLGFFRVIPSAHELEIKWITPGGQGAAELTPKSPSLEF